MRVRVLLSRGESVCFAVKKGVNLLERPVFVLIFMIVVLMEIYIRMSCLWLKGDVLQDLL